MATLLSPGDTFPRLELDLVGGGTLTLPDAFAGRYGVVLFNRGSWCPFCTGQLRAFQRAADKLEALGVSVASVSVDDEATAAELVAANGLKFPVGHSADARALAAATGAFVNGNRSTSSRRGSSSTRTATSSSASTAAALSVASSPKTSSASCSTSKNTPLPDPRAATRLLPGPYSSPA